MPGFDFPLCEASDLGQLNAISVETPICTQHLDSASPVCCDGGLSFDSHREESNPI